MRFLSARGKSSMSSLMMSIRSCSENNGPLPMLMKGPITSRSTRRNERRTISVWPLVTGSNVPGYTPTRSVAIAPPRWPDPAGQSYRHGRPFSTCCRGRGPAVPVAAIVLADAHRRDHALALADIDDAHAAGGATGDANSVHRTADQRAAIGHQHDLVAVAHRESRHDLAASRQAHELDAFAAAAGHPVLIGRGALAEARRGDREHELFLALQLLEAFGRQRRCRHALLRRLCFVVAVVRGVLGLAQRARLAQVGFALLGGGALAAVDQRHRDHLV